MELKKNQLEYKKIVCSNCNSNEVIKWCKRKTENRGEIQRYKCKSCSSYFTPDDGFFRMRNTPQKISQSIDLFYRGVSTRKVQEHLTIFHPHNASNVSVYNWVVKYAEKISNFTDGLKLDLGSEIQIDEVEFNRRKSQKRKLGVERNWLIDSIDTETRFMVASNFAKSRNGKEIKKVLRQVKENSNNKIKIVTTDAFNVYIDSVKRTFGYNLKEKKFNVIHNVVNASKDEGFNHPIERLHNNIRARTKVMRGFHGSVKSASAILKGYQVYYNFITKHQTIKCCPYELAVPELKDRLNVPNKWLELIKFSSQDLK